MLITCEAIAISEVLRYHKVGRILKGIEVLDTRLTLFMAISSETRIHLRSLETFHGLRKFASLS